MSDAERDLQVARDAASKAAAIIRSYQQENDFEIDLKGRNDLVTDADIAAEEQIIATIQDAFPDDLVLAEESAARRELPDGRCWLIDPIDGTTNFAHGFPVYCVSIGLWNNYKPKAGIVMEVGRGEVFEAVEGGGAYRNGEQLHVSSVSSGRDALIGTGFPYSDLQLTRNYLQLLQALMERTHGVRRPGAASYDLCCVAAGWYDGFYEYGLSPWDVGAGSLILQEAGGVISDWEGEDNWLFGRRVVAGNPDIHAFLLRTICEHFPADERQVAGRNR